MLVGLQKQEVLPTWGVESLMLVRNVFGQKQNVRVLGSFPYAMNGTPFSRAPDLGVGGASLFRDLWRSYYGEVHAVVFVVDAADKMRCLACLCGALCRMSVTPFPFLVGKVR